jgi:hypothetical protein
LQTDNLRFYIFTTIHDVLKAERILKEAKADIEVVPVPRALSSDCGVCIKTGEDPAVIASLIAGIKGIRCFVSEGAEYRPEACGKAAV